MKKKKVKLNKKRLLMVVIVFALIIIGISTLITRKKSSKKQTETQAQDTQTQYYQTLKSGIELNTSNNIAQTKTVEGLQINNIQITRNDGISTLIADVTNPTAKTIGGFSVNIKFLEENGNEISTMVCYIDEIAPGASKEITASSTSNVINCYDIEITKK